MLNDSANGDKPKQFLGLSGTQTIGSALAAVTAALVGSFLGVAGTLIGAALGSIVATVGAALYAQTLSSAARVASRRIPQRRRLSLPAEDANMPTANAPAEEDRPAAKRITRRLTPTTWIKAGTVSAAAFAIAMVGVTGIEFGTNQPISSLVSSTSSTDTGATDHTTTLGQALSGDPTVSDVTDESIENMEEVPAQVGGSSNEGDHPSLDGNPSIVDSGSPGTEDPGADDSSDTLPTDLPTESPQTPEPAPETEQPSEPEVLSDAEPAGE
jgi:hypothetical protein